MSNAFELNCMPRGGGAGMGGARGLGSARGLGKAPSRRLRRIDRRVPVVLYGGGAAPLALSVTHDDIYHATENEAFFSHIITLNIGDKQEKAVIKDLQRHPARPFILHADFQRVQMDRAITVHVPIRYLNEERCAGARLEGGIISKTLNEIEVSCLPGDLPEYIEVDLLELKVGDSIHLSEVALPEKVTSVALSHGESGDLTVASVHARRAEVEEEPAEAEAAEGEEAAEGDEKDKEGKGEKKDGKDAKDAKDDKDGKGAKDSKEAKGGKGDKAG